MKYIPKPNCAIIQVIQAPEKPPLPGALILPDQKAPKNFAKVMAKGDLMDFLDVGNTVIYDKYHAKCIDEDEKIYSITLDGIICTIQEEQ